MYVYNIYFGPKPSQENSILIVLGAVTFRARDLRLAPIYDRFFTIAAFCKLSAQFFRIRAIFMYFRII